MKTVIMKCVASVAVMALVWSCGVKMPEETHKSYETVTVKKQDITIPLRFSAKMKGTNDVTISPQVSGQLMEICVREGEQVKKGQKLMEFDIAKIKAAGHPDTVVVLLTNSDDYQDVTIG